MYSNYIAIEGLEGSGKTTASSVVINTLKDLGIKEIVSVREPGGTQFTEKLRCLMLNQFTKNEIIHGKTEALIFYAARTQLIEIIVKPALKDGSWVVSDRHDLSTQAYQGGGRGVDQKILKILHDIVMGNLHPGITFYLDVKPEIGLRRARGYRKLDRIERESLEFFNRVRNRYLELATQDETIRKVDAMQSLETVTNTIRNSIISYFQQRK